MPTARKTPAKKTPAKKTPAKKKPQQVQHRRAADHSFAYANSVGIQTSPWDFTLQFGRITKADDEGLLVEQMIDVAMSPQHTKSLLQLLGKQIIEYERKFGSIPDMSDKR